MLNPYFLTGAHFLVSNCRIACSLKSFSLAAVVTTSNDEVVGFAFVLVPLHLRVIIRALVPWLVIQFSSTVSIRKSRRQWSCRSNGVMWTSVPGHVPRVHRLPHNFRQNRVVDDAFWPDRRICGSGVQIVASTMITVIVVLV